MFSVSIRNCTTRNIGLSEIVQKRLIGRISLKKKIDVQLLCDVPGTGVAGQVIKVKPGFMRNVLHKGQKAAYVLPGVPPPLPIVSAETVRELRRKAAEEAQQKTQPTAPVARTEPERIIKGLFDIDAGMENLLDKSDLRFDFATSEGPTEPQADPLHVETLAKRLAEPFVCAAEAYTTGFLVKPLSKEDIHDRILNSVGPGIPASALSFQYCVPNSDRSYPVEVLDFVGSYKLTIAVDSVSITKQLVVRSEELSGATQNVLVRPEGVIV